MEHTRLFIIVLSLSLILLLLVNIGLISAGFSYINQIDALEKAQKSAESSQYEHRQHGSVNSAQYYLANSSMREVWTESQVTAAYIIQGYRQEQTSSNISVTLQEDGAFLVNKGGQYSIEARLTVWGKQKDAGIGMYIDGLVCDKDVQSVSAHTDPKTGDEYPTTISLKVSCLDKKLERGQTISIRLYHERAILNRGQAEDRAANWVHIKETL